MSDQDILVVQENKKGHDKVIGDLHGNRQCLEAVLDTLDKNDRLFIVGDLTDRGKDSPGVIKLINKYNQEHDNKILAIRGNHESLCLDTIAGLELLAGYTALDKPIDIHYEQSMKTVTHHSDKNGGAWLVQLFTEECHAGKIVLYLDESGVTRISYMKDSEVGMIKKYMEGLPYIIHVPGDKPFNMVHADMPFDDAELYRRIANEEGLTEEEKQYATWARESDNTIKDNGRSELSVPTFVGHSIVDSPTVSAVRQNTNTYDIDVGAFYTEVSLVVDITTGESRYIGYEGEVELNDVPDNKHLIKAQQNINEHLGSAWGVKHDEGNDNLTLTSDIIKILKHLDSLPYHEQNNNKLITIGDGSVRMSGDRVTPLLITSTHRIALKNDKLFVYERVLDDNGNELRPEERNLPILNEVHDANISIILSPMLKAEINIRAEIIDQNFVEFKSPLDRRQLMMLHNKNRGVDSIDNNDAKPIRVTKEHKEHKEHKKYKKNKHQQ